MWKGVLAASVVALNITASASAASVTATVNFLTRRGQRPVAEETVVWLQRAPGTRSPKASAEKLGPYQIVTRSKTLVPRVLAVPVGATVRFPNEDPISHNLFSLSGANAFDLGLYRRGAGKEIRFTAPGVVNVYCNVHPNMSAVIHVVDTPWFAIADAAGSAQLTDIPPGKYRLTAWNELAGLAQSDIEVMSDGRVKGSTAMTIDGRKYRGPGAHTNKHGKPYSGLPRDY